MQSPSTYLIDVLHRYSMTAKKQTLITSSRYHLVNLSRLVSLPFPSCLSPHRPLPLQSHYITLGCT